jgi:hypothetical protein
MVFATVRHRHAQATAAVLATVTLFAGGMPAAAGPYGAGTGASLRRVPYRGYAFEIPRDWPVINLAAHPGTCVRFDRHALYLGRPSAVQSCPSGLVGTTEAILAEPAAAGSAGTGSAGTRSAGTGSAGTRRGAHQAIQPAGSTEDPVAHRIVVSAPRITVTATYAADRAKVLGILKAAGLPAPAIENTAEMARANLNAAPALSSSTTSFTGLGFDACAAPSANAMAAWLAHSRYQAIGIYIGGSDRACAQPNLTAAWASQQAAAGWHFFPFYVGPQVAFPGEVTAARSQATAAAQDAVVQAQSLGFGPGTPIYYDMEAYPPSRSRAALKFFSSWTAELHTLGYKAAVYSSSDSGISDLAGNYTNTAFSMPDVIDDAWWNGVADTSDPNVPLGDWADHQRVHQFSGNVTQTHGGYTINLDQDYLDVQLGGGGGGGGTRAARQASQAVSTTGRVVYAFYAGTNGTLWYTSYRPHHGWSAPASLGVPLSGEPSAVAAAGGVKVFYRASDGGLGYLAGHGGNWSAPRTLGMGALGSAPRAVSTPGGRIAVFWRGADPTKLWAASYTPGSGWAGPGNVASGLASQPSPVVSGPGTVGVFWKGTDGHLWYTSHGPGAAWAAPARLNMGRLRAGPQATGQGGGQLSVFWGGRSRSIWHAGYTGQGGWTGAARAGGGMSGAPAVVASSGSTQTAFWKGRGAKLWRAASQGGASWDAAAPLPLGTIGGGVFAAGQPNGVVDVFWRGAADHNLWHSRYYPRGSSWTRPHDLGGNVG